MTAKLHTRLINMFMGLCACTQRWPDTLFGLGYRIKLIEQAVSLKSGLKTTPDLVAVSNRLAHAIVADCKGGSSIDEDQDRRYLELAPEDLLPHIRIYDQSRLKHAVCYVDTSDNHGSLAPHTAFPFITFGRDRVTVHGSFGRGDIDSSFAHVALDRTREPTLFYPFSPDDPDHVVVPLVLQELIAVAWKRDEFDVHDPGTREAILAKIHKHADLISDRHWNELVKKIDRTIDRLLDESSDLRDHVSNLGSDARRPSTMQGLKRTCEALAAEYRRQAKIDS